LNRISVILVALYLLGDPDLALLRSLFDNSEVVMAAVITLVISPWIRAQFDH